ncbi:MAG: hypothetical protein ACYDCH_14910 [Gaiellaceae bacterium]
MARPSRTVLQSAVAGLAALLLVAQPGSAAERVASIRVTPAVGGPGTTFVVSFVAPARTGGTGSVRLRDELTATSASAGKRCLAQVQATAPATGRGRSVRLALDPTQLHGPWCAGTYNGKVLTLQTAVCRRGEPCPDYVLVRGTVGRFSLHVRATGDRTPPLFAGLVRAFACTPGPQRPGQTTPYTLGWQAASDDLTPADRIVYDIYVATAPGGEDFSQPTWTTVPGATSFRTPGLPSHGDAYFVVRARDAAGNEDANTREVKGVDPCV